MNKDNDVHSGPENNEGIALSISDETANGVYTNFALVHFNDTEFTLDFAYIKPAQPKATVRARILASPKHIKRMIAVLQNQLAQYELQHGPVSPAVQPKLNGAYH